MPPKKQAKKKSAKDKKRDEEIIKIKVKLKELEMVYERKCNADHSLPHTEFKKYIKFCSGNERHLSKIIIDNEESAEGLKVKLSPIIATIRSIRYMFVKEIYVWDLPVKYEDLTALSQFFELHDVYCVNYLEFMDCNIDAFSLERFSRCLASSTLTALVLDYNKFGNEGCRHLCSGLEGNKILTRLSLNFCDLTSECGTYLGKLVSETAISALYLDGNRLECEGLIELLKMVVDKAEQEMLEKQEGKAGNSVGATNSKTLLDVKTTMSDMRADSAVSVRASPSAKSGVGTGKKKRRKKSAKKKKIPTPPKVGPWLQKLHICNNGIDGHGIASKYAPVLCMRLVKKWIANSADLQELDIDDNIIGDLGGREILDGLQKRKQAGLNTTKIWITHRMNSETFSKILTLGSGGAKKKKGKKKKGKKKI